MATKASPSPDVFNIHHSGDKVTRLANRAVDVQAHWNAIVGNGCQESACGWCKYRWGLSWQITPIALSEGVTDADHPVVAKRVFDAMMTMKKIDIVGIEAARRG